jgi:zinc protease
VKVGSADEVNQERGISHLIEHMAFKGTERRGLGKIAAEVEGLGGDINAYTSWDETVFHVTVPSHATNQGLDILIDAVLRPSLDASELEKEKQVVLEEILEGEERPERKASQLVFRTAYTESPYKYPIIGYRDTVEKFTRDDIMNFRKKWYVPENMFLLVVGDVNALEVVKEVEKLTKDLKPVGFFRPPRPGEPVQDKIRSSFLRDKNSRETRLHLAFHIPSIEGNDVNALDLTSDILGARDSSRLVKVLKKEKGLVNSISAYALTPKESGVMLISATLDSKNLETVTRGIMEELKKLSEEPPALDELERAKTYIESQHVYARETVQGIARSVGNYHADLGDGNYEEKYLRLNQAVTPEQVSSVVKKYLFPPNFTITALIPESDPVQFTEEQVGAILSSYGRPSTVVDTSPAPDKNAVTKTLENGLRIVAVPDKSNPVVSVRLVHLGGKRFETRETEGVMNFIAQMMNKGAGSMNEFEISRRIEDMGGRLNGFSGYDSFGMSASFFSRHNDQGLELLSLIHRECSFPPEELDRERALILNRIRTEPDRPVAFAINVLGKTLFRDNPYGFNKEGTLATVASFTRDDLANTYKRYAIPSNTVLSIVGDFDVEKTLKKIEELYGSIPGKKLTEPDVPKEAPLTKVREETVKIPRAKAHIALGFLASSFSNPDRYPLEVLNNILSGQGGRLFLELRDKESLAYSVASFVRPGLDPGMFAFYIACDVPKADRAVRGLFGQIDRVRNQAVSEDELKHSINNLVGNHLISLQSTWSRAENVALNTLYGLGYNYDAEYVAKIAAVKTEDVLRVAKKYLDPSQCALVRILPEETKD